MKIDAGIENRRMEAPECDFFHFFPDFGGFWVPLGEPESAQNRKKTCQKKVKKTRSEKVSKGSDPAECTDRMGRIIGGGKKPKTGQENSEGKIQEAKRLRPDLGRNWRCNLESRPRGRRIASRIPPGRSVSKFLSVGFYLIVGVLRHRHK